MNGTYYGQFDPPVDRFIAERYFPDLATAGVFVECGAFDGVTEVSCKYFEESMGWTGFNIEPVPWLFSALEENRSGATNLNFALSDHSGSAAFSAVQHPSFGLHCTNGSLSHTDTHKSWLSEGGSTFLEIEVPVLTWRDFIDTYEPSHIDLFVLDVEGHELEVIQGMTGSSVLPDVICVEVGHTNFAELRKRLSAMGYVYDTSSHVNAFFIHESKIALFTLRSSRAAFDFGRSVGPSLNQASPIAENADFADMPNEEIEELSRQVAALTCEIQTLRNARSLKFATWLRKRGYLPGVGQPSSK